MSYFKAQVGIEGKTGFQDRSTVFPHVQDSESGLCKKRLEEAIIEQRIVSGS